MGRLVEPWMLQGLLGRDTVGGIVDEDLFQKIPEVLQERCVVGDDFLEDG